MYAYYNGYSRSDFQIYFDIIPFKNETRVNPKGIRGSLKKCGK